MNEAELLQLRGGNAASKVHQANARMASKDYSNPCNLYG